MRLFVIVTPGLEPLALKEIELKCPIQNPIVIKGGIEFEGNLEWVESAHLLLKIPTRILMRVTDFKVRDFPKLFQKLSKFEWNKFLSHPKPNWEISCSKSRLNHTGRIEETLNQALNEALVRQPLSKDWEKKSFPPQTFYVRLFEDQLTLSLDLTGEPLYKRGLQTIKGEAPLRENLAAAFIFKIFEGIDSSVTLVDPMCGSGTLLTEALTFMKPLKLRTFAFESAPFYKGKILKVPQEQSSLPINKCIGFDINEDLIKKIETNLPIEFRIQNSLEQKIDESNMVMICNPPYGERIKIQGKRGQFLQNAWKKYLADGPLRLGWLLPSDMDDLFKEHEKYHVREKIHLKNGGLAVTFWIWERN
ncbi:MAG: class I SAM-dependent RNA methyltransferase [Bacteriovoracaceae bacterium]